MSFLESVGRALGLGGTVQTYSHHPNRSGRFYVYILRWPSQEAFGIFAGKPFYVGKGTNDRVFAHEKETRRILKSGRMMNMKHKHKVIMTIWDAGYNVHQEIVDRTDDEYEAYMVESKLISDIGLENLTNSTYGWNPRKRRGRIA